MLVSYMYIYWWRFHLDSSHAEFLPQDSSHMGFLPQDSSHRIPHTRNSSENRIPPIEYSVDKCIYFNTLLGHFFFLSFLHFYLSPYILVHCYLGGRTFFHFGCGEYALLQNIFPPLALFHWFLWSYLLTILLQILPNLEETIANIYLFDTFS